MRDKNVQYFNWGTIKWIYSPEFDKSMNSMYMGLTTILPGKNQSQHRHYGEEQFLYVISGKGVQYIDGRRVEMKPGLFFHIEAGALHESYNNGCEPLIHILISIPVYYNVDLYNAYGRCKEVSQDCFSLESIKDQIQSMLDSTVFPLRMTISVFDSDNTPLVLAKNYPLACIEKCSIDKKIYNCKLYTGYNKKQFFAENTNHTAYLCENGVEVYKIPIVVNGSVAGYLQGGHLMKNTGKRRYGDKADYYESPQSTSGAVIRFMRQIASNIARIYSEEDRRVLEGSLKVKTEKLLSIQINNHFLFNTFNAIASLALRENAFNTYQSVISLSNLFRHQLKRKSSFGTIKDEIEYLTNYVDLQKLRFGDELKFDISIENGLDEFLIPVNVLQPLVENSINHGFENNRENMRINLNVSHENDEITMEIKDNGEGMDEREVKFLLEQIKSKGRHEFSGIMMIYSKLELFFRGKFKFDIVSFKNKGTDIIISFPAERKL
ncbi:PocR sensory domain-containing protein [Peptoclostridium litorale DSM 5388]|uniref:Sensor histidine kinase YesM n=1 Tax=Peptoclostridium litorale DSM 5388 TaxID=1121324 RepID=A0A069RIZ6_PEPLI|nr:histidine kinase [Peptoclostridium litorale]KDR94217.1 sensor histidine kinase YesM [Peptoclostridium litorale DSM 5388]SIN82435.1 PocR sensory domain-containing protein [Peptoclostridium litorale DSM 5388]